MFLVLYLWFSMIFRLALISYNQAEVPVNWCPALGTVLANEEVIDGVSERGGYPVIRKVCYRNCLTHFDVSLAYYFLSMLCHVNVPVAWHLSPKSILYYPPYLLLCSQCVSGC
jgi:hypothetical protein